ncbi:MAG: MgtC/SapB family protein [Steroidobacteraceae bacterium]
MNALTSFWSPLVIGFVVALGVGLLIGVERERNKGSGPTRGAAGVRTFALVALLGAIAAALDSTWLVMVFAMGLAVFTGASYLRNRNEDPGLTTEVAMLVTYALGALAQSHAHISASLGVLVALLLASRSWLHELIRQRLSDREMLDGILLAAAALIVLPLLPDHAFDAYGVINPHLIWRITVLLLLINAAGYVALRSFSNGLGLAWAGFFGGFVSSAATVAAMAAHARHSTQWLRAASAGAAVSSVATVLQLILILYLAHPALATELLPALLVTALVNTAYGAWLAYRAQQARQSGELPGRAFELKRAVGFALLITVVMFVSAFLADRYGAAGASVGVALAGFADAHSSAASAATLAARGSITDHTAMFAILLAVTANTITKAVIAFVSGGTAYGMRVVLGLALMMMALWGGVGLTALA